MKNFKIFLLFIIVNVLGVSMANAQDAAKIKSLVESQQFVFTAESANPQNGGNRPLSTGYDLTVSKSSVVSYLPYFGRAYTPPLDPRDIGIKFTSAKFNYKFSTKNNKTWKITITPKDVSGIQELYLTIFDNGTATLDVTNTDRQNISFNGYIK